jgi:hypothetical protein
MSDTFQWDDEKYGGTPSDYGVDTSLAKHYGFEIGDRVMVTEDYESGVVAVYEGDEGTVIGFTAPSPGGGPFNDPPRGVEVLVAWDDTDPSHLPADYLS